MELLVFLVVSIGFIVIPGPNVLVIVSTSISHGHVRGLQTIAGISVAMAIQLLIAAFGTTWLVASLASGFFWLKWAGVIYLFYLGISQLIRASSKTRPQPISALGSFQRGFLVSLTNPKTILFFSAFLPQFVSPVEPYLPQIAFLSSLFLLIAIVLDSGYVLLANRLVSLLGDRLIKTQPYFSGFLYLGVSAALAVSKHEP